MTTATRLSKIIATLGPDSARPETIKALIQAGVNIFRINFSHGDPEFWGNTIQTIKAIRAEWPHPIGILADLQGPKIRVGTFKNPEGILLTVGETVTFKHSNEPADAGVIPTPLAPIVESIDVGQAVLLNDGSLEIQVTERVNPHEVRCKVIKGGQLKQKKGINTPGVRIDVPPLTEKDTQDCAFALAQGVDFLALSFVQNHRDILYLKSYMSEVQTQLDGVPLPAIVAKIETPLALDDIDAILSVTDAIMVARGDLGVELNPERVPMVQKWLINKANKAEKPVITATQMLESMIECAVPTRAEVSDVANAVLDGSDALMLSGETAMGAFPIETVQMMAKIMGEAEHGVSLQLANIDTESNVSHALRAFSVTESNLMFHQAIANAAASICKQSEVNAIAVLSFSGTMAKRISKQKPYLPIIALTPSITVYQKLVILWGVFPILVEPSTNTDEMISRSLNAIEQQGIVKSGESLVFCAGKTHLPGLTNTLKILTLN